MDLPIVARAALTVVFTISGVYCLLRCFRWTRRDGTGRGVRRRPDGPGCGHHAAHAGEPGRDASRPDGSGHGVHGWESDLAQVAMSGAMVAMLVTGFGGDRWGVQLTLFAVAAGRFLTRALPRVGREGRTGLVHHAVMMGGMVWMSLRMTRPAPMTMSAMTTSAMTTAVGPSTVATVAIAGYLTVAAVWWGRRSLAVAGVGGLFGTAGATTCHAVTSAAMAVLFVLSVHG
jgi:hypothetical protein